ncbi:MAG: chromosome segregation protein SMC [Candidatus Omnitrophica bacterium]|nr:chromosome segregation protein SMC [Candidatus Omnitrophota bacterium]
MYFKQLQIVGFKSFLNKTTLKFDKGITAVVGPNGCGKSNIVDSMKWVLGEQSTKSMRSSSMQDVIFNGTDKFEPVNVAEVSVTLSNENNILPVDYNEVTITRRLFRSGESEYLINKTPVRLLDVRNILLGTGIGTSSYSVIEQGKIDMILSSKPEERRHVFEEASGITKYKTRKHEAMLKLERTHENLLRLNDIIREVERQIRSIERQARKADRFRAVFDELKTLELKIGTVNIRELDETGAKIGTETDESNVILENLKAEIKRVGDEISHDRNEYNALMEILQEAQSETVRIGSAIDKNKHIIKINEERAEELAKYVQRLEWEVEESQGRKDSLKNRIDALEIKLSEVSERRKKKEEERKAVDESIQGITRSMEAKAVELKALRDRSLDIMSHETNLRNELIKTRADIHNASSREKRLEAETRSIELELEKYTDRMKVSDDELGYAREELENTKARSESIHNEYAVKESQLSGARNMKFQKESGLHQIRPKIEFLEKLIAEREGMSDSIKDLMRAVEERKDMFPGVHGILSELINVKEGYAETVESVLGDFSQAIVVNNRGDLGQLVSLASEKNMGSVSFVVLDEVRNMESDQLNVEGCEGIRPCRGVIGTHNEYFEPLTMLFNNILVSSGSHEAWTFLEEKKFAGRILCEKGEIFEKGRHRTRNHSFKEVYSLFGRREKLEELILMEGSIRSEISEIARSVDELTGWIAETLPVKESLEKDMRERQIQFADLSSKRNSIKERIDILREEIMVVDVERGEVSRSIKDMEENAFKMDLRTKEIEEESLAIEDAVSGANKVMHELTLERDATVHRSNECKIELSGNVKEEEHIKENLEREKQAYGGLLEDVDNKKENITESGERVLSLRSEARDLTVKNEELEKLKEEKIFEGAQRKAQKDSLAGILAAKESELREKENALESLRDRSRDLDIKKKEIEYKKENICRKILDNYKVELGSLPVEIEEGFNLEESENKMVDLKGKIEDMGEVSLGAVEEHKQLEERFAFLTKQRDDLVLSKDDIMEAVRKINATTKKLFMESFETIKTEFSHYFKVLFNGGKAEILLEDENDVLECGIDIVVRPPGKKLQNIMLLSGGEKAMTAIALIFALFKVNPSPFCILDEIDAPLDESNVVRFSKILKEFLETSQFIIVTHNRMTIQLADRLYGITMEEKGVSKVVTVKFADDQKLNELQEVGVVAS